MALLTKLQTEGQAKHHLDARCTLAKPATHKRGMAMWGECEGTIKVDDTITLFLPPQRIYACS